MAPGKYPIRKSFTMTNQNYARPVSMMTMKPQHPTYAINLKERPDRFTSIQKELGTRDEFLLQIISAVRNTNGALGLWQNILKIIEEAQRSNADYVIICEDDHAFTGNYSSKLLRKCILQAQQRNIDVLLGGVSWFSDALKISKNLFWVDQFTGLQFAVIFKGFFSTVLEADFRDQDVADKKIASLTDNKLMIYPFISVQKEFGYSDVTLQNNEDGYVTQLFKKASTVLENLNRANHFYHPKP